MAVNDYIRQFGPTIDIKHIKAVKEAKTKGLSTGDNGVGDDPIFEIKVTCPVCGRDDLTCYELRAKSQQILKNKFLVKKTSGYWTYELCLKSALKYTNKRDFRLFDSCAYRAGKRLKCISNIWIGKMRQHLKPILK